MYDIIIIGGGPAGLVAAVYARRAGKSVLVIEKATFGGQITYSPKVENIPGFVSLTGNEFAEKLVEQALELGTEVEAAEVVGLRDYGDSKVVVTESGDRFQARAVIIATGARHRLLGLENEENLIGNGISFCAVCDGAFYTDKIVGVVGGGNSALQEALLLSEQAKKVYVIQNLDTLTGEVALREQLAAKKNVEILLGTVVDSLRGEDELRAITLRTLANDSIRTLALDGLFIAIGLVPQNEPFAKLVRLDERGYVQADENCATSLNGVFVAGDSRHKRIRQVTTAAADGAVAALAACDYVDSIK
jgi:thioredoxin reductase (NADPH)